MARRLIIEPAWSRSKKPLQVQHCADSRRLESKPRQSSPRRPMRFKHLAVLSLVVSMAACGQGGGADKGGKGHGGPGGGGMPPAEVNVVTVQPQTLPVTLRVHRADGRLARSGSARARHRHPADAQLPRRRAGEEGPVAVHHRSGAVRGGARARRGRRRRGRSARRPGEAQRRAAASRCTRKRR